MEEAQAEKMEISASILARGDYCDRCGHRQTYHDGGLGSCRFDECGCTGYWAEAE